LQQYCIVLKCYITLEKDKDIKKKRNDQTPPSTPSSINFNQHPLSTNDRLRNDSISSNVEYFYDQTINNNTPQTPNSITNSCSNTQISSGGAKKVNVEVIMKSNPFRVGK
jgi:hypothetical protein